MGRIRIAVWKVDAVEQGSGHSLRAGHLEELLIAIGVVRARLPRNIVITWNNKDLLGAEVVHERGNEAGELLKALWASLVGEVTSDNRRIKLIEYARVLERG